ncbi:hypothetical protein CEUSTIGMA_g6663.t1 [Chlamydomonas eustigma]|uniref:JmjC domain-containing protein n=1 Tax=Chlamydomonas eustigma TaxID=1157962 RepID=A0A250X822_9CHLO|nr:hypothetical protein CEUSTIGMA_g6663.t1 [Chlamydomonas eustigma]|eukprot:GAX79223.1 hypothetical protein CEUSTIGMA_g6663.t1 [Chlamydomonas eustigma]
MTSEPTWCPTHRPTKQDFQRPFAEYVAEVFAKQPDLPMFKVCPPTGWRARRSRFPDLKDIEISTPIRQNVFGTRGAYRCIFMEQKSMTVDEFKRTAEEESCCMPAMQRKQKSEDDSVVERAFWSGITLNPPLYGADTPVSFFDSNLPYGWNLQKLGDLLKTKDVPDVPGVTTPMTYFGMWRSFFGWHKEDADLLSINYLHWGAPKMWYCVSPKDQARFDRMSQGIFPELHQACPAFIRHKDIMLSPHLLRTHNIPFMMAKQEEGEFIVLNASAYHSGFNMGFNCAEAINFATPAWIEAGKKAVRCNCHSDNVHISMRLFDPEWSGSDSDGSSDTDVDSEVTPEVDRRAEQRQTRKKAPLPRNNKAKKLTSSKSKPVTGGSTSRVETSAQTSHAAARKVETPNVPKIGCSAAKAESLDVMPVKRRRVLVREAHAPPADVKTPPEGGRSRPGSLRLRLMSGIVEGKLEDAHDVMLQDEVVGMPCAIIGEEEGEDGETQRFFCLVQQIKRTASEKGQVVLRWLQESSDGLYRPVPTYWEEPPEALVPVRTQYLPDGKLGTASASAGKAASSSSGPAWKLLTLKSRLLDTELIG